MPWFRPEFIDRLETILDQIPKVKLRFFVGEDCPSFAESYERLTAECSTEAPSIKLTDDDRAAIYFSSGTTGFPKAILHSHRSLVSACETEQKHHGQTREDNFLCIPPLYHTGAKMHWFGSLLAGSKAVLLRGVKPEWILEAVSDERSPSYGCWSPGPRTSGRHRKREVKLDDYELDQWRLMHIGAQPVPPSLIHRWKKYFRTISMIRTTV